MRMSNTQVVSSVFNKVINKLKQVRKRLNTAYILQEFNYPEYAVKLRAKMADRCGLAVAA